MFFIYISSKCIFISFQWWVWCEWIVDWIRNRISLFKYFIFDNSF